MILMLIVLYDSILPRFRFHCPALLHSRLTATAALYSPMNAIGAPGLREQACICLCLVESGRNSAWLGPNRPGKLHQVMMVLVLMLVLLVPLLSLRWVLVRMLLLVVLLPLLLLRWVLVRLLLRIELPLVRLLVLRWVLPLVCLLLAAVLPLVRLLLLVVVLVLAAAAGGTPTSPSCNCFASPRDIPMCSVFGSGAVSGGGANADGAGSGSVDADARAGALLYIFAIHPCS